MPRQQPRPMISSPGPGNSAPPGPPGTPSPPDRPLPPTASIAAPPGRGPISSRATTLWTCAPPTATSIVAGSRSTSRTTGWTCSNRKASSGNGLRRGTPTIGPPGRKKIPRLPRSAARSGRISSRFERRSYRGIGSRSAKTRSDRPHSTSGGLSRRAVRETGAAGMRGNRHHNADMLSRSFAYGHRSLVHACRYLLSASRGTSLCTVKTAASWRPGEGTVWVDTVSGSIEHSLKMT